MQYVKESNDMIWH